MRVLAIMALCGLAGCAPAPKAQGVAHDRGCGDARVAGLVGKTWSESMRSTTLKTSGARALRVIAPDTVVTMDYRPDRLNVEIDTKGRITRLRCG